MLVSDYLDVKICGFSFFQYSLLRLIGIFLENNRTRGAKYVNHVLKVKTKVLTYTLNDYKNEKTSSDSYTYTFVICTFIRLYVYLYA